MACPAIHTRTHRRALHRAVWRLLGLHAKAYFLRRSSSSVNPLPAHTVTLFPQLNTEDVQLMIARAKRTSAEAKHYCRVRAHAGWSSMVLTIALDLSSWTRGIVPLRWLLFPKEPKAFHFIWPKVSIQTALWEDWAKLTRTNKFVIGRHDVAPSASLCCSVFWKKEMRCNYRASRLHLLAFPWRFALES